jgi:hypothetical protein
LLLIVPWAAALTLPAATRTSAIAAAAIARRLAVVDTCDSFVEPSGRVARERFL